MRIFFTLLLVCMLLMGCNTTKKVTDNSTVNSSSGKDSTVEQIHLQTQSNAALKIARAISNAKFVKASKPHSRKQVKRGFVEMYELSSELPKIGTVKIMVGKKKNQQILHYCITKKIAK